MIKWPFFSKKNDGLDELLERYRDLRQVERELNVVLAQSIPKLAVTDCGKKLGLVNKGILVFKNDDEIAILYDYCFHHFKRDNKNVIERFLQQSPPIQGSMQAELLDAMQASFYSIFRVEEIHAQKGARLRDLVTGEAHDIIDLSLSNSGEAGIIVMGRLLPLTGLNMSSGTLIPVHEMIFIDRIKPIIDKFMQASNEQLSNAQKAAFSAQITRVALYSGGEDNVFYTDMEP